MTLKINSKRPAAAEFNGMTVVSVRDVEETDKAFNTNDKLGPMVIATFADGALADGRRDIYFYADEVVDTDAKSDQKTEPKVVKVNPATNTLAEPGAIPGGPGGPSPAPVSTVPGADKDVLARAKQLCEADHGKDSWATIGTTLQDAYLQQARGMLGQPSPKPVQPKPAELIFNDTPTTAPKPVAPQG